MKYNVLRMSTRARWQDLTDSEAQPGGGTPLYDAAYRTMERIIEDNPERAIFVVMTDGEENSSTEHNQNEVRKMVSKLKDKKYEVVFLGANFDNVGMTAQAFGEYDPSKFVHVTTKNLDKTLRSSSAKTMSYFASGAAVNYSAQDKSEAVK